MLSSQTNDEVADAAVDNLRAALGGTFNPDAVSYRRAGNRRRHQQRRLLTSQDTVRPHASLSFFAEWMTDRKI